MNDYPRRRRALPEGPPPNRGIPIFPLILVVIFAGLLLGGLLARFMGHSDAGLPPAASPLPSFSPIVAQTAPPTLGPALTPKPKPSPSAKVRATVSPAPLSTASAKPSSPPVVFVTPQPKATSTAPLVPATTPTPATKSQTRAPGPTPSSLPPEEPRMSSTDATGVVHGYLSALARGDESTAASYLMSGLPTEKFMSPQAKITSIGSTKNSDGSFKVSADIQTPTGEYYETFTLETGPNGLQITDHTAIKP